MKKKSLIFVVVTLIIVTGCQQIRQTAIDISVENAKNAETIKEISLICKEAWLVESGFIDGLGLREDELPKEVIEAKEQLDLLAEKEELTDYELGLFLGLKVRLLNSVFKATLEKYAPDVIGYLPMIF